MKTLFAIALSTCVAAPVLAAPATAPAAVAATEPAQTWYAGRNLSIQWDRFGPDQDAFLSFIRKQVETLAPKILNLPGENIGDWFSITAPVRFENSMRFGLEVNINPIPPDARPAAREFADQLVKAIEQYVADDADRQLNDRVRPLHLAHDNAQQREQDCRARFDALRAKMRDLAGREASAKGIGEALAKLDDEQEKLELEVLGKTARREALEQMMSEQSDRIEKKVASDPILVELQKVVDAKEMRAKRLDEMIASKAASQSERDEAVGQVAEARAKLLERKRDAMNEAGGEALSALNRELLTLWVDLKELNARLKYVKEHIPRLREAMALSDDVQSADADLTSARADLHKTEQELRDAEVQSYHPPRVIVIDSANREKAPPSSGGGGGRGGSLFGG